MGYIKKLKNNELVGGTDKHTIYPVTSAEAVFEEVSDNEFKSQKYLNNHITNERIVDNTIENSKLKDDTIDMGKLNTQLKTIIQNAYDASWKVKEEPFSLETKYDANDVVYDPATNSSYVSLTADNQGNPVDPNAEGYVEGKWRIVINGISAIESTEVINTKVEELETEVDNKIDDAQHQLDQMIADAADSLADAESDARGATEQAMSVVANKVADAQIGYFECNTAANTSIKATTSDTIGTGTDASTFKVPATGASVKIKMKYANTADTGVKLQFGSNTATQKDLLYNGLPVSASNTWEEGEVISVYYDGTYYQASNAQGGGGNAEKIKYDNSQSGLAADNVQEALDEISKVIINEEGIAPTISVAKVISGNNVWESFSGMNGEFVPVVHGKNYRIVIDSSSSGVIAFVTRATQSGVYYAGGATSRTVLPPSSDVVLTAPDDANYLYYTQIGETPATVRVYEVGTIQDDIDNIYSRVGALEEDSTAPIEDEIDLSTKIAAGNYGFWGGIWRANTQHSGWFIPISGESIRVVAGNGIVYCMFCSGTTQTANTASSYVSGPFLIQSGDALTDDIPENATYLWCNINTFDKRVLPSEVYCTRRYGLNSYAQKIEPKISSLTSKVGTIEDIGDTIGNNDALVRTFKGIVFYNKDDNELYIRSLTTGTWIYKDVECLRNPIIEDGSPDASIIVVDSVYYVFTTSDGIFRSTDFVHWERLPYKTVPESYTGSQWAPDVNYLSNKYVIYLTYNGNSLLVLSSDTILNEDRYTVEAELNLGSIDYCYYNGYLFYGSGTVYRRTMTDYKTPADDAVTLSGPNGEGPMLWHNGDYYYMFTSTPVSQTYQYDVKVYRASSLTATTWESGGKILGSASSSEILNGPGHVSEVLQDADGRYFMMMQIHIYNSGWTYRPTIIQEFRMNSNGWPEFIDATGNVITKPSIMCRKPKLPLTVLK